MDKKNYLLTGFIAIISLVLGFIIGLEFDKIQGVFDTKRTEEVGEELSASPTSVSAFKQQNFQDTVDHYLGILEKSPGDISAITGLANLYFEMNQFNEAIRYLKMVLELDSKDVNTYNELGLSYHYIGLPEEGLKYVEEGINIDPLHQRIRLTKGFVLASTGRVSDAIKAWDKAYSLGPDTEVGKAAIDFLDQYRPISSFEAKPPGGVAP